MNKKVLGGILAALMVVPTGTEAAEQGAVKKLTMREKVANILSDNPFSQFYRPSKAKVKKVVDEECPLMKRAKDKNPKPRRSSIKNYQKGSGQQAVNNVNAAAPVVKSVAVTPEIESKKNVDSVKPAHVPDFDKSEKVVADLDKVLNNYKRKKAKRIQKHVEEKKATETEEILEQSKMIRERIEEKLRFCKGEVALKYNGTNVSLDSEKVAEEVKECMVAPDCEYKKKLVERQRANVNAINQKPVNTLERENVLVIEDGSVNDNDVDNDKTINDCRYYEYKSGTKNLVMTYPGIITDVSLQPGESIERITVGDKHRWEIDTYTDTADGAAHVYIQPIQDNLETNMIILTDRRTYQLSLATSVFYDSMVAWKYPGEAAAASAVKKEAVMEVESADMLTFDYNISRSKKLAWAPRFIFDDGFNTYIAIDPDEIAKNPPAIFTENRIGNLVLVDYELVDDNIILSKVYKNLQLRVRDDVIKVIRINIQ